MKTRLRVIRASAMAAIAAHEALIASVDALLLEIGQKEYEQGQAAAKEPKVVKACPECGAEPEFWMSVEGASGRKLCKVCNKMFSLTEEQ